MRLTRALVFVVAITLSSGATGAFGQGFVYFNTQTLGDTARITLNGNNASGSGFTAQLWATDTTNFTAVGTPVHFRRGYNAGFVQTEGVDIFGSPIDPVVKVTDVAGGGASVQIRAWAGSATNWAAAQAAELPRGQSRILYLSATGYPPLPPPLLDDGQGSIGFSLATGASIFVNGNLAIDNATATNSAQVQIISSFSNAVIRYTLNGAYPGTGPFYNGPFILSQSATIRALAYTSNYSSSVESQPVSVTVIDQNPPFLTQQPQNISRLVGQSASFTVASSGTPPLSYQWRSNTFVIVNATNATLDFPSVQANYAADYSVSVQNAYGAANSASAHLMVYQLPSILAQPSSTNISVGGSVTFSVTAQGTPPLLFQWRLNGVNLPNKTNNTLVISNVQITNGGSYTVVIANDFGTLISDPARLIVQVAANQPGDNFANAITISGNSGNVSGTNTLATKEFGEPNHADKVGGRSVWYRWQPASSGIATFHTRGSTFDTLLAVYTGPNVSNLTVVASDEDSGGALTSQVQFNALAGTQYTIAIDGSGAVGDYFILNWSNQDAGVTVPVILQQPRTIAVVAGSNGVFNVTASGGTLSYQWLFGGQEIFGKVSSTLTISNAQISNVGYYTVRISNTLGRVVTSVPAGLELVSQPSQPSQDKFEDLDNSGPTLGLVGGKGPPGFTSVSAGTIGFDYCDNTFSSGSPLDPPHCIIGGWSRYLVLQPQASATLGIDTIGSQIGTVIAVYRAATLSELSSANFVACDVNSAPDGRSLVTFPAEAGVSYAVLVDGTNSTTGRINIHYCLGSAPTVAASSATPLVREGGTLSLVPILAGTNVPTFFQWYKDGVAIAGANGATYIRNNATSAVGGLYSVIASNCLGFSSNLFARVSVEIPLHLDFQASRQNGQWQFHLSGSASHGFVVESTTNFLNWIPLITNTVPDAPLNFSDPAAATAPTRFYRAFPWP